MKKRTVIILFSAVLLMILTVTGCYRKTPEQRADRIVNDIVKKLDLNETQKAKLETIKQEFLAKGQEIKKTREETYDQMIGFMRSPSIDQAALSSLVEKDKVQLDDLNSFLFAKFTEFHNMLTPEQREKAAKEMEHWREKYKEHEH